MSNELEIFKKKILYRASYRGTKEMDILLSNFVNKYINEFDIDLLNELDVFLSFEDETISANVKNLCVSKTHISDNANVYSQVINKYTKLDPTLPRVNNLKCPNKDCLTNSSDESKVKEREIIYIRYDDKNMKYVYLCSECDHVWKT